MTSSRTTPYFTQRVPFLFSLEHPMTVTHTTHTTHIIYTKNHFSHYAPYNAK